MKKIKNNTINSILLTLTKGRKLPLLPKSAVDISDTDLKQLERTFPALFKQLKITVSE